MPPSRIFQRDQRQPEGMPPGMGETAVPHVYTFAGLYNTFARTYMISDEAMRQSWENARFMRNDARVMECLEHRRRCVSLLDWGLTLEGKGIAEVRKTEPKIAEGMETLTAIFRAVPRFMQFRENLMDALWYGVYGVQQRIRWEKVYKAKPATPSGLCAACVKRIGEDMPWKPIHGDKLVFRYDDPELIGRKDGAYPGQLGIRVAHTYTPGDRIGAKYSAEKVSSVQATDRGLAYFLDRDDRSRVIVHRHMIEDTEFETPERAGRLHGVGIRDRIYWLWTLGQEFLGMVTDFIERSAFGFEIWYYNAGNPDAKNKTEKAAEERLASGSNVILCPVDPDSPLLQKLVERIEPGFSGVESVVQTILKDYIGNTIKRYILGQTLTTESDGAGLGSSGIAGVHLNTFYQIIKYDATNLEETLSDEFVRPYILWNCPQLLHVPIRFTIQTEQADGDKKIQSLKDAYEMDAKIPAKEVYEACSIRPPEPGDEILQKSKSQANSGQDQNGGRPAQGRGFTPEPESHDEMVDHLKRHLGGGEEGGEDEGLWGDDGAKSDGGEFGREKFRHDGQPERYQREDAAAALAEAVADTETNPSDEQKAAGNYRKGKVNLWGLPITIENPRGSVRSGKDRDGNAWSVEMPHHYGYIRKTESEADGDHIDVFIGPHLRSEIAFVVDQIKPGWQRAKRESEPFDEHKVMLGFTNSDEAERAYRAAYADDWTGFDNITPLTIGQLKAWVAKGDTGRRIASQVTERYAKKPAKNRGEFKWITIGGSPDGDGHEHAGGTPVAIDSKGTIVASRAPGLQGKNISEAHKHFGKPSKAEDKPGPQSASSKPAEKPKQPTAAPVGPHELTFNGKPLKVKKSGNQWMFQRPGMNPNEWVHASAEMGDAIEEKLGASKPQEDPAAPPKKLEASEQKTKPAEATEKPASPVEAKQESPKPAEQPVAGKPSTDLFGQHIKPEWKQEVGEGSKGKQESMFFGLNDNPDQGLLFDEMDKGAGKPEAAPQQPPENPTAPTPPKKGWESIPEEGRQGFEHHVMEPLRSHVQQLDDIRGKLGPRYSWESAIKGGQKPGDPHPGSEGVKRWVTAAGKEGHNGEELVNSHPEYQDLVKRLDEHRDWGSQEETRSSTAMKPAPKQPEQPKEPQPAAAPANPSEPPKSSKPAAPARKVNPKTRLGQAITSAAHAAGLHPDDLADAVEYVHKERSDAIRNRETAKAALRASLGLTAGDLARLENKGQDYATAAKKIGGATGAKLARLDTLASSLSKEHPDLMLGDPEREDVAANIWKVLREGAQRVPQPYDPKTIEEAVNYATAHGGGDLPQLGDSYYDDFDEAAYHHDPKDESIPFKKDGLIERFKRAAEARGWPKLDYAKHKAAVNQKGLWDEDEHPRNADGEFAKTGSSDSPKKPDSAPLTKESENPRLSSGGSKVEPSEQTEQAEDKTVANEPRKLERAAGKSLPAWKKDGAALHVSQAVADSIKDGDEIEFEGKTVKVKGRGQPFRANGFMQVYLYTEGKPAASKQAGAPAPQSNGKPATPPDDGQEWYPVTVEKHGNDVREYTTEWRQRPTQATRQAAGDRERADEDSWLSQNTEAIEGEPQGEGTIENGPRPGIKSKYLGQNEVYYRVWRDGGWKWFKPKGQAESKRSRSGNASPALTVQEFLEQLAKKRAAEGN